MSDSERVVVVVDRDPFATKTGQWAQIVGVLRHDEIRIRWAEGAGKTQEQMEQKWWKWNLVVCLFDSISKDAIPLVLCDNSRLAREVWSFVSVSAAHLREGKFLRLQRSRDTAKPDQADMANRDDVIRDALGGSLHKLPLARIGELVAAARSQCLRLSVQGEVVSVAVIRRIVSRLVRVDDATATATSGDSCRKRKKRRRLESQEQIEERKAKVLEFFRLKKERTYSSKETQTKVLLAPFAGRNFVRTLDQFYDGRDGHPGYMRTVARYADGLPPWDRVFVEEWTALGIEAPAPPLGERMLLLQYPNDKGMGYSFAVCDASHLETLISTTDNPTFSEVYRHDLAVTAIPIDWDMPVDEVAGPIWDPEIWLTRIQRAANAALNRLLPSLDAAHQKRSIVQSRMWISEEMKANITPDGSIDVKGLDKITVHANLLLPSNVILWNYRALRIVYEEMERQDNARSSWYLDKSITKLRLPGCFKLRDDGAYVHRLVPWRGTPARAFEALVHARHDVKPWEGVDMAVVRSMPPRCLYGHEVNRQEDQTNVPFEDALQAIRSALAREKETAAIELVAASKAPFVGIRKRTGRLNWCIIKGGSHSQATMYFVVMTDRARAWIHCHSDRCKNKRMANRSKPYINLIESRICWTDS